MKKVMLVVFNGEEMCFIHVLLNALDMSDRSYQIGIIIEGASTKLIPSLEQENHFLHSLWTKVKERGLVEGVCKACANKMGTLQDAQKIGLAIVGDMSGHPSLASYIEKGFQIITF